MSPSRRSQISDTLRQRVLSALHFRTVSLERPLPSARRLARDLGADPRVILAAYRSLEREGLVHRRPPSRGYFVVPARVAQPTAPAAEWLVEVLVGGLAQGVPAPAFPEQARRSLETLRLRAVCLESTVDHLTWLARELEEDFGLRAVGLDVERQPLDGELPAELRSADLLVTTARHEAQVRLVAERLGRPVVVARMRPDLVDEIARLLAAGPLYVIGTDERLAAWLNATFAELPGRERLQAVVLGQHDLAELPDGAPAYVMRTARERLGGAPERLHVLSTLRAFSAETQRDILRLVVQANLAAQASRPSSTPNPPR